MDEINEEDVVNTCNFCGATDDDGKTDCLIMGQDGTLICNSCIARCEALLADRKRDDIDFQRFQAKPGYYRKISTCYQNPQTLDYL